MKRATKDDNLCTSLPTCELCLRPACDHGQEAPHAIDLTCMGYRYPEHWICSGCGAPSIEHSEETPHTKEPECAGYQYHLRSGMDENTFVGGGGRFGGGGASGGW